jgi:hypothetical protein
VVARVQYREPGVVAGAVAGRRGVQSGEQGAQAVAFEDAHGLKLSFAHVRGLSVGTEDAYP